MHLAEGFAAVWHSMVRSGELRVNAATPAHASLSEVVGAAR